MEAIATLIFFILSAGFLFSGVFLMYGPGPALIVAGIVFFIVLIFQWIERIVTISNGVES